MIDIVIISINFWYKDAAKSGAVQEQYCSIIGMKLLPPGNVDQLQKAG